MSNTQNNPADQNELLDLKRQARTNALRLKIAQQNAALAALRSQGYSEKLEGFSYSDPTNYVDYRDYLLPSPPFFGALPTTRNDRDQGRDFPIFQTEQELAVIRGAARLVTASNPIAVGILTSLTNYVIGNGFRYAVAPRGAGVGVADLAKIASAVIEEFLDQNNWSGDLDRELFQRSRVDGEYFLSLWHVGDGRVQARAVEPDQVTQPTNPAGLDQWLSVNQKTDWTFGVQSDADDAQAIHGFFVQWTNRDQDWDFLPGGNEPILPPGGAGSWMEHAKLNVVRSVKRGLSDSYAIEGNLDVARRVLRNMGEGSAVQAAITWIQEVAPGTTQAQVNTGTMMRADASYTTPSQSGSRQHWLQQYDPATILKVPSGQKYLPGPLGAQHAPNFITAAQALLRSVAVRWSLPENFVTGTAENNNFASSLVAESPFVKFAESQQQFYAQRDRRTLDRVLWFAWMAGRFGEVEWGTLKRSLRIDVTPPQIEVRDPEKETAVRKTLHDAGLLSRKTWAAQEGLDFEQEQSNLAPEAESATAPDSDTRKKEKLEALADLLERFWNPAKHPRGGYPQNSGWFSPVAESPSRGGIITGAYPRGIGAGGANDASERLRRLIASGNLTGDENEIADNSRSVPESPVGAEAKGIAFQGTEHTGLDWPSIKQPNGDRNPIIFSATTRAGETFEYTKVDGAFVVVTGGSRDEADGGKVLHDAHIRPVNDAELAAIKRQLNEPGDKSPSDLVAAALPTWMRKEARDWLIVSGHLPELKWVEDMKREGATDAQILASLIPHMAKQEVVNQLYRTAIHGVGGKLFGGPKLKKSKNRRASPAAAAATGAAKKASAAQEAELAAQLSLTHMQGEIKGGHFLTRHSPIVTRNELLQRATVGIRNKAGKLVKDRASKFLTYADMKAAIDKAIQAYNAGGGKGAKDITIGFSKVIGEGFYKNGNVVATTTKAIVKFDNLGHIYTAYPILP